MDNVQRFAKEIMRNMETMKIASGKPIFLSLGFLPSELKIRGSFDNVGIEDRKSAKSNSICQPRVEEVQCFAKETMRNMETMKIVSRKSPLPSLGHLPGELNIHGLFGN